MRIDQLLVKKGFVETREKAKRLIMAGEVFVNGEKVDKPSRNFDENVNIFVKTPEKYVSRGGYKIESAWKYFKFDVSGKVVCDIGASTGGFTDFLLQNGAKKVYAVDVGKGQLHWKLRNDPRVVVMEKVNARYLNEESLGERVDLITCDVSFISLRKIIPVFQKLLKENGEVVLLVKPQFEAKREEVKKGLALNKYVHIRVLRDIIKTLEENGFSPCDLTFSKVRGTKGNIEYFIYSKLGGCQKAFDVERVVNKAWEYFNLEGS